MFHIQNQTKSIFKPDINLSMMNYRFASRTGKLRLDKILQLNLRDVIANNSLTPLESLSNNMIYSNIDEENDFDSNTSKLLKTFQYSLEYLYNRQLDLEGLNKTLENDYSQLINDSYAIEEKLKTNKIYLAKQAKDKKEKEMLLTSYKAIIDYHTKGADDSNKELKELLKNPNEKYYCHLCSGKQFSTGGKLESHMKRRHINQYSQKDQMNESFENYGKQIEEMKKYFETMLKEKEEEQMKLKYLSDLDQMKNENEKKVKEMESKLKDTLFEFKEFLLKSMKNQPQPPIILEQSKMKDNQDLLKMAQSLNEINALIRSQYDKKIEEMNKEINELKNRPLPKQQEIKVIEKVIDTKENKPNPILSPQKEQRIEIKESYPKSIPIEYKPKPKEKEIIAEPSVKSPSESQNEKEKSHEDSYHSPSKKESLKQTILASEVLTNKSIEIIPHKKVSQQFEHELLPKPPKVNLNKTVGPERPKRQFKPIHFTRDLSKTMTVKDQLEEFFAKFTNRDNALFEIEEIKPRDYVHSQSIIPMNFVQKEEDLKATLHKSLITTAKKDNFMYESFEDKDKRELINIIEKTLKNIEETNSNQEIAELYFNTVQKAIDLKLYEVEKNDLKETILLNKSIVSKHSLHSKRSKISRAAEVIKKANEDIEIEF